MRERDGARYCRVRRSFEESELRDAEAQHVLHRAAPRRQGAVHELGQKGVDLAQAAERGEQQQVREGGVAGVQCVQPRRGGERLIQGAAPAQDRAKRMGRDPACIARRAIGRRQSRRGAGAW